MKKTISKSSVGIHTRKLERTRTKYKFVERILGIAARKKPEICLRLWQRLRRIYGVIRMEETLYLCNAKENIFYMPKDVMHLKRKIVVVGDIRK